MIIKHTKILLEKVGNEDIKKFNERLAEAQREIVDIVFNKKKEGKIVLFLNPKDKEKGYISRIEFIGIS